MDWEKYRDILKQDIQRSYSAMWGWRLKRAQWIQLGIIFALNIAGVVGFTLVKEDFPVWLFVGLWVVSACVLVNILWHIFSEEIRRNMPDLFATEYHKHGKSLSDFKCRVVFIGKMHFRGCNCDVYIFGNEILIKYRKYCLVINSAQQIKMDKFFAGYHLEFQKDEKYVQCRVNEKQAECIRQWINLNGGKRG